MAPPSKESRAKAAKITVSKTIPALLKSTPRARRGVGSAQLIVDPPPLKPTSSTAASSTSPIKITLRATDTLTAAASLVHSSGSPSSSSSTRIAILNMASPLRPGGGVLTGASSQEEFLCVRTTLLPSLRESFYRLPDVGGVYTPDVLVFASSRSPPAQLPPAERFYVEVVTSAMLRFPDLTDDGARYAEDKDREMAVRKMRAVLRMCVARGVGCVVLGAWGCGAYGNPVGEVAGLWRRVLLGREKGKGKAGKGGKEKDEERWEGLKAVVFAVKDGRMAGDFARAFGDGLEVQKEVVESGVDVEEGDGRADVEGAGFEAANTV